MWVIVAVMILGTLAATLIGVVAGALIALSIIARLFKGPKME